VQYFTRAIIFLSLFAQILLRKFSLLLLVILSFQCQSSFSASTDTGDSFWNEITENCQDWWDRITNDPLPNHAIFYIVNYSDNPFVLEFEVGENNEKIIIDKPIEDLFSVISLTNLRRGIKKKDGYEWGITKKELTYKISKIMYENPPTPAIRFADMVLLPTKLLRSNIFFVFNGDAFCLFADFEVGKYLLSDSLGLPKEIRLYILSLFLLRGDLTESYELELDLEYELNHLKFD
jgi:hypothetical protein